MFYSPATGHFHDSDWGDVPDDAVRIDPARHSELVDGIHSGSTIAMRAGQPVLVAPKAGAELLQQIVRQEARKRILAIAPVWKQINDLRSPSEQGALRFRRIDAVREASERIEQQLDELAAGSPGRELIENHPFWPEFD